jgi:eukaryotic-like serine/threonine-protein kinase
VNQITMPEKFGRYQVERELGRGGMGIVYLARDPFIGRQVAVKSTLNPPPKDPAELRVFQAQFFNEAQAAGKLAHPNIVYLHDACVEVDRCYLVLEYVAGVTLKGYCRPGHQLPVETVVNIIYQSAKALDHAHSKEVIHRDIKPSNIMITPRGVAKITDFGIAAVEGPSSFHAQRGVASVCYSSPEQLRENILNHQTDLFSLGVVMYEMLTGVKPFEAESDVALFFKITKEEPLPLNHYRQDLPESLQRIVDKAMQKDLSERYKTGRQMAWELSAYFDHLRRLEDETNMEEKFHAIKKINFFKDFRYEELAEVIDVTQWVTFEDQAFIIAEGAIEDCFYIIVDGQVRVSKRGKVIRILRAGDCFGEMAYMGKTTRTADVEAVGKTSLMRVNPTVIDQTSKATQLQFYRVFATTLVQRLIETSDLLSQSTA